MGSAKEKAKELVEKYFKFLNYEFGDEVYSSRDKQPQKCALIAVDEILSALTDYGEENDELQNMESDFRFYEKVKSEIEKL